MVVGGVLGAYYLRAVIPTRVLVRAGAGLTLLSVVVLIGAVAVGYGDLLLDRFGLLGSTGFEASSGRTMIWTRALGSMFDHPVTLITGFGWFAYESSRYFSFATHNSYLNILYNLGLIGLSLFLMVAVNVLRVVRRGLSRATPEARPWLIALSFGFPALLVALFFGELHSPWIYVWALVGITLRIAVLQNSGETESARQRSGELPTVNRRLASPSRGIDSNAS